MEPHEAARVSRFMAQDTPMESPSGKWKVEKFVVTQEEANVDRLRAHFSAARREGVGAQRWVPPGTYVALRQRFEREDVLVEKLGMPRVGWATMMSDTPNEIEDHGDPISHGTGRVLIHGLGLGCIVAGLLEKRDVTHIDVVEIDQEVIDLTGHYYSGDPRVTIHHGDALMYSWPRDMHWDYVWHDIWLNISANNLDEKDAENGVTYQKLLRKFERRAVRQDAWAYDEALRMREVQDRQRDEAWDLVERWKTLPLRERTDLMVKARLMVHGIPGGKEVDVEAVREAGIAAEKAGLLGGFNSLISDCEVFARTHPNITDVEALLMLGYVSLDDAVR